MAVQSVHTESRPPVQSRRSTDTERKPAPAKEHTEAPQHRTESKSSEKHRVDTKA